MKKLICFMIVLFLFAIPAQKTFCQKFLWTTKSIMEVEGRLGSNDMLGYSAISLGDINSDGYPDFAVSSFGLQKSYVYFGGPGILDDLPDITLSYMVWLFGDINGDGYKDLICHRQDDTIGNAYYIYYGKKEGDLKINTTANLLFKQDPGHGEFGQRKAIGDLNGDGFQDIVFTSGYGDATLKRYGEICVWLGKHTISDVPDFIAYGKIKEEDITRYLKIADINGDGYDDLMVGRYTQIFNYPYGWTRYSLLDIYYGKQSWKFNWDQPDQRLDSRVLGKRIGEFTTGISDFNQDGICDIYTTTNDSAFIYLGRKDSFMLEPDFFLLNPSPDKLTGFGIGQNVLCVGDVNGDGYKDYALRFSYYGGIPVLCIYLGTPKGISREPDAIRGKIDGGSQYGNCVIALGDVNGDGLDDFLTTAPTDWVPTFPDPGYFVILTGDREWQAGEKEIAKLPENYRLFQNYPNPFNPYTKIKYRISETAIVNLRIYDLIGREVYSINKEKEQPGEYIIEWNGKNSIGNNVSSGVYFYTLEIIPTNRDCPFTQTRKMLLIR